MYTIKQASARTGLGAPLIRAWERRYGVFGPCGRAGYRLYDERSITSPAGHARADAQPAGQPPRRPGRSGRARSTSTTLAGRPERPRRRPRPAPVTGAADRAGSSRGRGSNSGAGPKPRWTRCWPPGRSRPSWTICCCRPRQRSATPGPAGRLSVAGEHAASAAMARRLAAAFQAAGGRRPGVAVIVGLPPGSRHELGALAFAAALRRRGVGVLYLGPDVPIDGWVDVVGARTPGPRSSASSPRTTERPPRPSSDRARDAESAMLVAVGGARRRWRRGRAARCLPCRRASSTQPRWSTEPSFEAAASSG